LPDPTRTGLCRLIVHADSRQFELAVPVDVPLGDLLPALVNHVGTGSYERMLIHQGYVLQRLGEPPLDEDRTVDGLGLRDGELVYLRARSEQLPPVHFDDLVDGIGGTLRTRADTWGPGAARVAFLAVAGGVLATALVLLAFDVTAPTRVVCSSALTVLLLLGAGAAARALDDRVVAGMLGIAATLAALLAGGSATAGTGTAQLAARAFAGGCVAAATAVLALAAVGALPALFVPLAVGYLLPGGAALLPMLRGGPLSDAVALLVPATLALGQLSPMLALRVAGLRAPPLPANAEQLQEGIDPYPGATVVDRAAVINRYVTGLHAVVGAGLTISITLLVLRFDLTGSLAALTLSVLMLLHSRQLGGLWQRLTLLVPAGYGVLATVLLAAGHLADRWVPLVFIGLVLLAAGLLVCAWTMPGRRLVPYWGRAAEIAHLLFAIALVPLLAAHLGVFGWARGLFG